MLHTGKCGYSFYFRHSDSNSRANFRLTIAVDLTELSSILLWYCKQGCDWREPGGNSAITFEFVCKYTFGSIWNKQYCRAFPSHTFTHLFIVAIMLLAWAIEIPSNMDMLSDFQCYTVLWYQSALFVRVTSLVQGDKTLAHEDIALHLSSSQNEFSWGCKFAGGVLFVAVMQHDLTCGLETSSRRWWRATM